MIILQAAVVFGAIVAGVRMGGIGLGLFGGLGVLILVFVFGLAPGSIPKDAILIILAVITAAAAMEAAGGIAYLVSLAEKAIRSQPRMINFYAPLVTLVFCAGAGTGNIIYPLLPVIYEVAYERGVRPERALSTSVAASGVALAASPVSAAMAAFVGLTATADSALSLGEILAITFPASVVGVTLAALVMTFKGKNLADDPEFQRRIAAGEIKPPSHEEAGPIPTSARNAAWVFLAGVAVVVLVGGIEQLRPVIGESADGEPIRLDLTSLLIMVMLTVALLVVLVGKVTPKQVLDAPLYKSGLIAIVALLGVAWLANTFIEGNEETFIGGLTDIVEENPWALAIGIFLVAALTTSQSTSVNTMVPLGLSLGLSVPVIAGQIPAMGGIFTLPANGSQLAAVEIDQTGSTKIGSAVFNHSFLLPMLVTVIGSVLTGLLIASLFF